LVEPTGVVTVRGLAHSQQEKEGGGKISEKRGKEPEKQGRRQKWVEHRGGSRYWAGSTVSKFFSGSERERIRESVTKKWEKVFRGQRGESKVEKGRDPKNGVGQW